MALPRIARRVASYSMKAAVPLLRYVLLQGIDPFKYGPVIAGRLVAVRLALYAASPLLALLTPCAPLCRYAIAALIVIVAFQINRLYESILASGLEDETPSLTLYLLPYSWSTQTVADLIARLSKSTTRGFRWIKLEAARLASLLDAGLDPLRALSYVAETTPSTSFRRLLEELTHASRIGYPRTLVVSRLAEWTLERVRSRWQSYAEAAKIASEINAALIVALGALAPLSAFAGVNAGILYVALIIPAVLSLGIALIQPGAGPGRASLAYRLIPAALAMTLSVASYTLGPPKALALLAPAIAAMEVIGFLHERRVKAGIEALARASREARLGRPVDALLEQARPVDHSVIDAIRDSVRIAGMAKAWLGMQFLERSYREAKRVMEGLRGSAFLAIAVALMASGAALYSTAILNYISSKMNPQSSLIAVQMTRVVEAAAPLAAIPGGILLRPRVPSALASFAALTATWVLVHLINSGAVPLPLNMG